MVQKAVNVLRWNVRFLDMVVVAGLLWLLHSAYVNVRTSAADYFVVNKVEVVDHVVGSDPQIVYDRTVIKAFSASWQATVKSIGSEVIVCIAHGHYDYKPSLKISDKTLSWYLQSSCPMEPGEYLMTTTWKMSIGRDVSITSNIFRVYSVEQWSAERESSAPSRERE